MGFNSGFKVLS